MLQKILVPLDGSALAERALPYAIALAHKASARILIVRAAQVHTFPGIDPVEAQVQVMSQAEGDVENLADKLADQGLTVEPHVCYGDASSSIVDLASRQEVDMIVMSTHGRSGVGRWIFGSVADHVLRHAEVPVLLVPVGSQGPWPEGQLIRVLVPLDGSELAEQALGPAEELADLFGGELLLVRAVAPPDYFVTGVAGGFVADDTDVGLAEAELYLTGLASIMNASGRRATTLVFTGDPSRSINSTAQDQGANIVVMATHGRGGLARLVLGSVATGVIRAGGMPILLVRPSAVGAGFGYVETTSSQSPDRTAVFRCAVCGRPVHGDPTAVKAEDRCVRCQTHLHTCRNCVFFDSIRCVIGRDEAVARIPGLNCPVFAFRWEKAKVTE